VNNFKYHISIIQYYSTTRKKSKTIITKSSAIITGSYQYWAINTLQISQNNSKIWAP